MWNQCSWQERWTFWRKQRMPALALPTILFLICLIKLACSLQDQQVTSFCSLTVDTGIPELRISRGGESRNTALTLKKKSEACQQRRQHYICHLAHPSNDKVLPLLEFWEGEHWGALTAEWQDCRVWRLPSFTSLPCPSSSREKKPKTSKGTEAAKCAPRRNRAQDCVCVGGGERSPGLCGGAPRAEFIAHAVTLAAWRDGQPWQKWILLTWMLLMKVFATLEQKECVRRVFP